MENNLQPLSLLLAEILKAFSEFRVRIRKELALTGLQNGIADVSCKLHIWAKSYGLFKKGNSAFENRYRDSAQLLGTTRKWLQNIKSDLADGREQPLLLAILNLTPRAATALLPNSSTNMELEREALDKPDFESKDDEMSPEEVASLLQEIIQEIDQTIVRLFRICAQVPSKGISIHRLKVSEKNITLEFDAAHVLEKLRSWGSNSGHNFLTDRLISANTTRRRHFWYLRDHTNHLARLTSDIDEPLEPAVESAVTVYWPLSGTTASHIMTTDIAQLTQTNPATSYVSYDLEHDYNMFPSPPRQSLHSSFFECPYCYEILERRIVEQRGKWKYEVFPLTSYNIADNCRKHIIRDLRPFICTYEHCSQPDVLYSSLKEWTTHEDTHRMGWQCLGRCELKFPRLEEYQTHIREKHPDEEKYMSSREVIRASTIIISEGSEPCPFCDVVLDRPGAKARHVGNHLIALALFVLPKDLSQDSDSDVDPAFAQRSVSTLDSRQTIYSGSAIRSRSPSVDSKLETEFEPTD
jgi:hypothetical protein